MAGAAELLTHLIGAAVGNPSANISPAAGGYVYTPDQQLQDFNSHHGTDYKSIDEAQGDDDAEDDVVAGAKTLRNKPVYLDKNGNLLPEGTVKSPDDLLPMQKPSFMQRWWNPSQSEAASALNNQYQTQPDFSNLANRTQQGIATGNLVKAMPAVGQVPNADNAINYAAGGARDLSSLQNEETAGMNIANGVPQSDVAKTLATDSAQTSVQRNIKTEADVDAILNNPQSSAKDREMALKTGMQLDSNKYRSAYAFANKGGPEQEAKSELKQLLANALNSNRAIKYAPQQDTLYGKQIALDTGEVNTGLTTLPARSATAISEANVGKGVAGEREAEIPSTVASMRNQALLGEETSKYAPYPLGQGLTADRATGTISSGRTGYPFNIQQVGQGYLPGNTLGPVRTNAQGQRILPPITIPSRTIPTSMSLQGGGTVPTAQPQTSEDENKKAKKPTAQQGQEEQITPTHMESTINNLFNVSPEKQRALKQHLLNTKNGLASWLMSDTEAE